MRENGRMISALARYPPRRRKDILRHAPRELVHALSEGCLNILRGNVPLSRQRYTKLRQHRRLVHELANPSTGLRRKQRIIQQRGGFVGALLGALAPVAATLVSDLFRVGRSNE